MVKTGSKTSSRQQRQNLEHSYVGCPSPVGPRYHHKSMTNNSWLRDQIPIQCLVKLERRPPLNDGARAAELRWSLPVAGRKHCEKSSFPVDHATAPSAVGTSSGSKQAGSRVRSDLRSTEVAPTSGLGVGGRTIWYEATVLFRSTVATE